MLFISSNLQQGKGEPTAYRMNHQRGHCDIKGLSKNCLMLHCERGVMCQHDKIWRKGMEWNDKGTADIARVFDLPLFSHHRKTARVVYTMPSYGFALHNSLLFNLFLCVCVWVLPFCLQYCHIETVATTLVFQGGACICLCWMALSVNVFVRACFLKILNLFCCCHTQRIGLDLGNICLFLLDHIEV